jgi:hypothetical protein
MQDTSPSPAPIEPDAIGPVFPSVESRRIDYSGRRRWSEAQQRHHAQHVRGALVTLLDQGPSTARDVAEATGVSRVTATTLLQELVERDIAQLVGLRRRTTGPQARVYDVRAAALRFTVAVFRPGRLVTVAGRSPGSVERSRTVEAGPSPDAGLIAAALASDEPRRVVIGVPDGSLPGLPERLGCPVEVRSHADLAAVAEAEVRDVRNFLLVSDASIRHVVDGQVRPGLAGSLRPFLEWLTPRLDREEALLTAVAAACLVTDPELIVLGEDLRHLREPLRDALPTPPEVALSAVSGDPVLRGALHLASDAARSHLLRLAATHR